VRGRINRVKEGRGSKGFVSRRRREEKLLIKQSYRKECARLRLKGVCREKGQAEVGERKLTTNLYPRLPRTLGKRGAKQPSVVNNASEWCGALKET